MRGAIAGPSFGLAGVVELAAPAHAGVRTVTGRARGPSRTSSATTAPSGANPAVTPRPPGP